MWMGLAGGAGRHLLRRTILLARVCRWAILYGSFVSVALVRSERRRRDGNTTWLARFIKQTAGIFSVCAGLLSVIIHSVCLNSNSVAFAFAVNISRENVWLVNERSPLCCLFCFFRLRSLLNYARKYVFIPESVALFLLKLVQSALCSYKIRMSRLSSWQTALRCLHKLKALPP